MGTNRRSKNNQELIRDQGVRVGRGNKRLTGTQEIKGIIVGFYLPGDESPSGLNANTIRVMVDLDDDSQSYKDLRDVDIILEYSPHVSGMIHGSNGLLGTSCIVKYQMPNIKNTARAYLESVHNSEPVDDELDTKYDKYLRQKVGSLTGALLA